MSGCKLSPVGLGMSLGVIWGLSLFLLGLLAYLCAYGQSFVSAVGSLYFGYEPSISGSILGGVIGFIDAFIKGFLIAWLYNKLNCCKAISCCKTDEKCD